MADDTHHGWYRYERDWLKPPTGLEFGAVTAVATDADDNVFVLHRGEPSVLIFDRTGTPIGNWGTGLFAEPHGMSIAGDRVYVTDRVDSVCLVFTLDGKPVRVLGERGVPSDTGSHESVVLPPRSAGPFNYPTELVRAESGDLFASDGYRNASIHRFSGLGELMKSWGKPGKSAAGEFHLPHSLAVIQDRVYVCDRENSRIQVFTVEGDCIEIWTDLVRPADIAVGPDGLVYVSELGDDQQAPRVSVMTNGGEFVRRWESRSGHGIWVNSAGDVLLALNRDRCVDRYVRTAPA